jgi:hypothetical protein
MPDPLVDALAVPAGEVLPEAVATPVVALGTEPVTLVMGIW